jgi:hypothetical protein
MWRLIILALALVPMQAGAASQDRKFAVEGLATMPCETFLKERSENSKLYWNAGGWIDGFLTAYNAYVDDTFDLTIFAPNDAADLFARLVARHCRNNPSDQMGLVVKTLAEQMHDIRLEQAETPVELTVADQSYSLYPTAIKRMKTFLANKGLYDGPIDAEFSGRLQTALEAYQDREGLPATGAPTQETILRILYQLAGTG